MVTSMAGNPSPIWTERGPNITALRRSYMNCLGMFNDITDPIGQCIHFIIIGTHALDHQRLIYANHVAVTYFQLIRQEGQQRNTEGNFPWLSSGNVVCHRGTCLDQIVAQFIGEDGQWTCTIMFEETHIDVRMLSKSSIGN